MGLRVALMLVLVLCSDMKSFMFARIVADPFVPAGHAHPVQQTRPRSPEYYTHPLYFPTLEHYEQQPQPQWSSNAYIPMWTASSTNVRYAAGGHPHARVLSEHDEDGTSFADEGFDEELFVQGSLVVHSKHNKVVRVYDMTEERQPIREAVWARFCLEDVELFKEPAHAARTVRALCIFFHDVARIIFDSDETFTVFVPFLIHHVWPVYPYGIVVQRVPLDRELNETNALPFLLSLSHPLDEFLPVAVAKRLTRRTRVLDAPTSTFNRHEHEVVFVNESKQKKADPLAVVSPDLPILATRNRNTGRVHLWHYEHWKGNQSSTGAPSYWSTPRNRLPQEGGLHHTIASGTRSASRRRKRESMATPAMDRTFTVEPGPISAMSPYQLMRSEMLLRPLWEESKDDVDANVDTMIKDDVQVGIVEELSSAHLFVIMRPRLERLVVYAIQRSSTGAYALKERFRWNGVVGVSFLCLSRSYQRDMLVLQKTLSTKSRRPKVTLKAWLGYDADLVDCVVPGLDAKDELKSIKDAVFNRVSVLVVHQRVRERWVRIAFDWMPKSSLVRDAFAALTEALPSQSYVQLQQRFLRYVVQVDTSHSVTQQEWHVFAQTLLSFYSPQRLQVSRPQAESPWETMMRMASNATFEVMAGASAWASLLKKPFHAMQHAVDNLLTNSCEVYETTDSYSFSDYTATTLIALHVVYEDLKLVANSEGLRTLMLPTLGLLAALAQWTDWMDYYRRNGFMIRPLTPTDTSGTASAIR
jgi:hypothetical protein